MFPIPKFNPAALFICFRESLEAVIVVTVLLQFLNKTLSLPSQAPLLKRLQRHVWLGAIGGLAGAMTIGGLLVFAFYMLKTDLLGSASEVWESAFELIAVVLQT
jgi:high-affinity iron transporter